MSKNSLMRALFCILLRLSMVLQPLAGIPVHAAEPAELIVNGTYADEDNDGKTEDEKPIFGSWFDWFWPFW